MVSLSWIDIHYLTDEFNKQLKNAKIENIYGNHEELHIKLYKSGQKNLFLSAFLSSGVVVMNNSKSQHNPKNIFIQFLRKYLKNSTLEQCISYIKERIVSFKFTSKSLDSREFETYYLHIELFMGGQIYLCNSQNTILKKLKYFNVIDDSKNSSTSKIYNLPSNNSDLLKINKINLDVSKTLQESIKHLGIGKKYVNYISKMIGITPQSVLNEIKNSSINELVELISKILNFSIKPTVIENSKIVLPFNPKELHKDIASKQNLQLIILKSSYSHEIIRLYGDEFFPKLNENKEPAKLTKLKKRLQEQEKNLRKIQSQIERLEQQAGSFYEYYQEIQQIQQKINTFLKKEGFNALKDKIKNNKNPKKLIADVDDKNKKIMIETDSIKKN